MTKDEAKNVIDAALARMATLENELPFSAAHVSFIQSVTLDLARIFGGRSTITINFSSVSYQMPSGRFPATLHNYELELLRRKIDAYLEGLERARGILLSAREQLERYGVDKVIRGVSADGARVFISHGTETAALAKVENFLRALGAQPVVVMRHASEGMAVDDAVEKRVGESDCGIVLATADEQVGDRRQPRPNVLHEIGLLQQKLENRVIYLKEEGCEFPSNVKPKIWENFRQDNMEAAFAKISKELKAFGLL